MASQAQDKQLRLLLVADETSFGNVTRMVRELTSQVQQLVSQLNQAGTAMAKMGVAGTGGSPFVAVGTKSNATTSGLQGAGGRIASGVGGATSNIARVVADNKNILKSIASESSDAMKGMNRAVNEAIGAQGAKVDELRRKVLALGQAYRTAAQDADSSSNPAWRAVAEEGKQRHGEDLNAAVAEYVRERKALGEMGGDDERRSSGGQRGRGNRGVGAVGSLLNLAGGQMGLPTEAFSGTMRMGANLGGVAGYGLGIAAGGLVGWGIGSAMGYGQLQHQYQYRLDRPNWEAEKYARIGGSSRAMGVEMINGDFGKAYAALNVLQGAGGFAAGGTPLSMFARDQLKQFQAGDTFKPGDVGQTIIQKTGQMISSATMPDAIAGEFTEKIAKEAHLEKLRFDVPAERSEEFAKAVQQFQQADPWTQQVLNQVYQNAPGRLGLERSLGIGWAPMKDGKLQGSDAAIVNAYGNLHDPSEVARIRQQVASEGGRGSMKYGEGLLGLEYGGLHSATHIFGVGKQYDDSKGRPALLNALQGMIGRGGVDITAGDRIGQLAASYMTNGSFSGGTGAEALQGMLSAVYTGTPGGDMRNARIMEAGMGARGTILSGQLDPLQSAMNHLAAIHATGGGVLAQRQALEQLDPFQMMQIMRGGKVGDRLSALGVSGDTVKGYAREQEQLYMARPIEEALAGTPAWETFQKARAAGGIGAYLKGLKKEDRGGAINKLAAVFQTTGKFNWEQAKGLVGEFAAEAGVFGTPEGRGSHDPVDPNSPHADAFRARGKQADAQAQTEQEYRKSIKTISEEIVPLGKALASIKVGADGFDTALEAMTTTILAQLARLDKKAADKATAKVMKAKPPAASGSK